MNADIERETVEIPENVEHNRRIREENQRRASANATRPSVSVAIGSTSARVERPSGGWGTLHAPIESVEMRLTDRSPATRIFRMFPVFARLS